MNTEYLKRHFNIILSGFLASLVMFIFIFLGINLFHIAPFNIPPSAAFLYNLGIEGQAYALLLHFCYGILWSYVLVIAFEDDVSIDKALILSIILWLFMMIVYSPLIGWGIFGFGYSNYLSPEHPLHMTQELNYILTTLILHLIYGTTLGYLITRWINK